MKNNFSVVYLMVLVAFAVSCKTNIVSPQISNDAIIGSWIKSIYFDQKAVYYRSDSLKNDNYGYTFFPNGELIERKNSGWCGTPPISFSNFKGTWSCPDDSTINIVVGYWGGTENYSIIYTKTSADTIVLIRK